MAPPQLADPADQLERLERWVAELRARGLSDEASLDSLQATLAQARGERLDVLADPLLVVMLCGPTAVGKSSLLNAIAGAEISRSGFGAMTSTAVLYVHEQDDPSRLFEYGETVGQLVWQPHTVVRHGHDALLHKVLVDTPDIDSVILQHHELTAALVHAADVVLFVTTPEKYKTMQAAQWVAQQCRQRALAFVLHKWDREGIGLQYTQRDVVEGDFRRLLAESGFTLPVLFKVSSLSWAQCRSSGTALAEGEENQLPELKAWLEAGLNQSAAAAIQDRRHRAAWGHVAAAVAAVVPSPMADESWVAATVQALRDSHLEGQRLARSAVAAVAADYTDRAVWPGTPGLFGTYARFLTWCASKRSEWRALGGRRGASPRGGLRASEASAPAHQEQASPWGGVIFGDAAVVLLGDVTERRLRDVETRRLPLQPVRAGWTDVTARLATQLAALPAHVEEELLAEAMQPSARRFAGSAALAVVEVLLSLVLLLVVWRVGKGFLLGEYASASMLLSAAVLLTTLTLAGHIVANLCFPSLRDRFQAALARRATTAVDAAWQHALDVLQEHVEAVGRLAQQGHESLRMIDSIVQSLARPRENDREDNRQVQRLFGDPLAHDPMSRVPVAPSVPLPECQRLPKFD
jgi:energy-coupling factor transporter ATP-binding protein EcfA2